MKIDGPSKVKLYDKPTRNIFIAEQWLYFTECNELGVAQRLLRMKFDGTKGAVALN